MMEALNLSTESTKAIQGSEWSHDDSASTFDSEASPRKFRVDFFPDRIAPNHENEMFVVEGHANEDPETSYYEDPESPQHLPPQQLDSSLRDITNTSHANYDPKEGWHIKQRLWRAYSQGFKKYWEQNYLEKSSIKQNDPAETHTLAGRGNTFASAKQQGLANNPCAL